MKTKIKLLKLAAITLSLCLVGSAFAGCSSSSSSSSEPDQNVADGETHPEKPNGGETPPDKPDSNGNGSGGVGGGSSFSGTYTAVKTYTADATSDSESFSSTDTDENAVLIQSGAKVVFNNPTVTRTSFDSTGGDNSSFYGVGAALLTTEGTAYINGGTITTNSAGGAGAFAYDSGIVYIKDTVINTAKDTSGGIHAAGGGTLYAWDLTVTTNGNSSAAIRSDRGGGTMVIDGGTYTSNGVGSPAVYCTADIAVNGATLAANASEGVCIEGLNSLYLYGSALTCNMSDDSQNDTTWGIIVYQSNSGDSQVGNSTFSMVGGSLKVNNGGVLYTTNTECDIYLSDVDITPAEDSEFFFRCTGNANSRGWGMSGSNGSDCDFTAYDQEMTGDVVWDSVSELDFYMTGESRLTGAILDNEECAGSGGSGYCSVYISQNSVWTVTGDSTVTNLYVAGTIKDEDGNTVTIKGSDGTVYVQGTGSYTITITGSYAAAADLNGAFSAVIFDKFKKALPSELS